MDTIFNRIKLRKLILIYVTLTIVTFVILKLPFLQDMYAKDHYWGEVIHNLLSLASP